MKTNSDRFKAMLKDRAFKQPWRNGRDVGLQSNTAVCSTGENGAALVYHGINGIAQNGDNFAIISRDTAALLDFDAPTLVEGNNVLQEGVSVEYQVVDADVAMSTAVANCLSAVLQWQPLPKTFGDDLAYCLRAAATDQARPMLCGIIVKGCKMAAADGFRLHIVKDVDLPDMRFQTDAIVTFLKNAEPDEYAVGEDGHVYLRNKERGLYLACAHTDQNYPDYEPICPKLVKPYTDNKITFNVKTLSDGLAKYPRQIESDQLHVTWGDGDIMHTDGKTKTAAIKQDIACAVAGDTTGSVNAYYNLFFLRESLPPVDLVTLYTGKVDEVRGHCKQPATLIGGRYTAILMPMYGKEGK